MPHGRHLVSRLLRLSVEITVGLALVDPARIAFAALGLSRARAKFPELFDAELAAESVTLALQDALADLAAELA